MISFIIPAYNASETIEKCIDSIINQEKSELEYEIIVVNDCSIDDTENKIKKYDDKIIYIKNEENKGLSETRNVGLKKAKGEYIIYIDSDDYISKNLLKDIEIHIKKDVDLVKWYPLIVEPDYNYVKNDLGVEHIEKYENLENLTGIEVFNKIYGKDKLLTCAWLYAFKRELAPIFPVGRYHEDFAVIVPTMLKAKKMSVIPKEEYFYVMTKQSIMRNPDEKKLRKRMEDLLYHFDNMIKEFDGMEIDDMTRKRAKSFAMYSILSFESDLNKSLKKEYIKELKKRKIHKYLIVNNFKSLIKKVIFLLKY